MARAGLGGLLRYLLDTNICIFLMKATHPRLAETVVSHPSTSLAISAITVAELWHGVHRSQRRERAAAALATFLESIRPVVFDEAAAERTGAIVANLRSRGQPIGVADALIAGHALALGATLVTNNTREFRRVKGLAIEDWTKP